MKVLFLRRPDAWSACATPLAAGTKAAWDAAERRRAKLLRPGDVDTADREAVAAFLDQRFPPAA